MILAIIIFIFAFTVGLMMELYKKKMRKDKAGDWENKIIALGLSAIFGYVFFKISAFYELSAMVKDTPWLIIPSALLIYILQLPACMAFWKPLLKKWMKRKLK